MSEYKIKLIEGGSIEISPDGSELYVTDIDGETQAIVALRPQELLWLRDTLKKVLE